MYEIKSKPEPPKTSVRRNWSKYSKEKLIQALATANIYELADTAQHSWNIFENELISIIDSLAPMEETLIHQNRVKKDKINGG